MKVPKEIKAIIKKRRQKGWNSKGALPILARDHLCFCGHNFQMARFWSSKRCYLKIDILSFRWSMNDPFWVSILGDMTISSEHCCIEK